MMKKIRSTALSTTKIQNSHQVAVLGKSNVKQRRGWSRRNLNSSQRALFRGANLETTQMTNLSMHGKPVLPMMIRKLPTRRIQTAYWKDNIESGVRVKPRSLNIEAAVKTPLMRSV